MTAFITPVLPRLCTTQRRSLSHRPRPRLKTARPRTAPHALFQPLPPQRPPDYHANVGKVIDVLRNDIPLIMHTPMDMSIYHPQILFTDSNGASIQGMDAYRSLLWLLRTQAKIFFSTTRVEIQSVFHDDYEARVYIRWRLRGELRVGGRLIVDGLSVYRLGADGRVVEHILESVNRSRGGQVRLVALGTVGHGKVVVGGCGVGGGGWYTGFGDIHKTNLKIEKKTEEKSEEIEEEVCV